MAEKILGGLMAVAALITFVVSVLGFGLGLLSGAHFAVLLAPTAFLAWMAHMAIGDE